MAHQSEDSLVFCSQQIHMGLESVVLHDCMPGDVIV